MTSGEVYEVLVEFQCSNDMFLKRGDIIEIISTISMQGLSYVHISRYADMLGFDAARMCIEQCCYCVSSTPLDKYHPLRNKKNYVPVPFPPTALTNGPLTLAYPGYDIDIPNYNPYGAEPAITSSKKCECGVHAIGLDKHSDYCQFYKKD